MRVKFRILRDRSNTYFNGRRKIKMANVSDSYLEDYIDNKFDNFNDKEDIDDLELEIVEYVRDAKRRRLKEIDC